ncbi:MAG: endonuclease/exonuclease/phosphatase family protein [Actinomycetes bacterium]
MRISTWNILHGRLLNLDNPHSEAAALSSCLAQLDPDILALQEVDHYYPRSGNIHQTQLAASALGANYWAFAPAFFIYGDGGDHQREPSGSSDIITSVNPTDRGGYGISIVSKIPVTKWERLELTQAKFGKIMNISEGTKSKRFYAKDHHRVALAAHCEGFIAINLHLSFVWPFNYLQFLQVKRWANQLQRDTGKNVLIMGDFNLSQGVVGRKWKSLFNGLTFPIWEPDRQIDYILTSSKIQVQKETLTAFDTSDHLAVSVEVDF